MEKKKIVTPKESMCSSRTFEAANISFSFSFFFFFFLIFSAGVFQPLVFVFPQQSLLHEETGHAMQLFFFFVFFFRLTQKPSRTWVWAWTHVSRCSVCNHKCTHTHFRLLEETPPYYHPHREGGTSLTSPGGHLTSFSQSGILLKPTVATAAAGHVFKRFSS